jgi:hypothetical protein
VKHVVQLILETDNIDFAKGVAQQLSRQRKRDVSVSEAVDFIIALYWKKTLKRMADQKFADRVGDKLKGTKLVRPNGTSAAIAVTK